MSELPVEALLPEITQAIRAHNGLVICAPPGSGKTTKVAPALIDAGLCAPTQRTFLLQPRRIAARATAQRIAEERGCKLGDEIGYQVRFDSKTSSRTSIVVATEGILLRRIAEDPTLDGIDTVILDEFHERSLNADLLLSMLTRIRELVRDDLRIVVMSATLDPVPLEAFLKVPSIVSDGSLFPVDLNYRPRTARQPLKELVAQTIQLTLQKSEGDILVFLPGVGEISQVENELSRQSSGADYALVKLHGSLPLEQQREVLRPLEKRKVILSTNVAETSLTIEGIRVVIDSGLAKLLRFDPAVGIDRLQAEPISQASATQRAGRAGRLSRGKCIRLWDERSQRARPKYHEAEISRVDLSSALLQLYAWGESPDDFRWFEPPKPEAINTARQLLTQLGALDENGRISSLGTRMASLPTSPRLAKMLATAEPQNKSVAAFLAAMLSERDPFMRPNPGKQVRGRDRHISIRSSHWSCDITQRVQCLRTFYETTQSESVFGTIHRGAARNIQRVARQLLGKEEQPWPEDISQIIPQMLLAAFPDRLAKRRKPGDVKGRMVSGKGVRLSPASGVTAEELFLCIDVDGKTGEAMVRQASGIPMDALPQESIHERNELFFNPTRKCVEARRRRYWFDLMLEEQTAAIEDDEACREILFLEAQKNLQAVLPPTDSEFHSYWTRMQCLADWAPDQGLPTCDEALLTDVLRELCVGRRSFSELKKAPWLDWLKSQLDATQQQAIDRECPDRIAVPSGNRLKITYEPGKPPTLAVRIQEVFSWTETPRLAFGKVPLLLHLLAPNFRPQQVTDDLASFWKNTYEVVRKELRRRYPKHSWPEDPLSAKPESKGGRRRN